MRVTRRDCFVGLGLALALCSTPVRAAPPSEAHEHVHVREPMVFDLVRGMGAKRGELEINTLLRYDVAEQRLHWAPELEWVVADGVALELELPALDDQLEAVKLASQFTLPALRRRGFSSGIQTIVEFPLHGHPPRFTGLYLAGMRVDRLSLLAMVGPRVDTTFAGVTNLAMFVDVEPRAAVGVELDSVLGASPEFMVMPQLHLQVHRRFRVQSGAGVGWSAHTGTSVMFAMRVIFE
jgi:hypothetical protein